MYRIERQISLEEFETPFGELDSKNRWVKLASLIDWDRYEIRYAQQFCDNNGSPAIPFRLAMGTLIIKQSINQSDDGTYQSILENPYMQFFIGLHGFTTKLPFSLRSITNFRKYITEQMIDEINRDMFATPKKDSDKDNDGDGDGILDSTNEQPDNETEHLPNKGSILMDATCTPANIAYPTDAGLLNEAREKLEETIDTLHKHTASKIKPRTYRKKARQNYLKFAKNRKPSKQAVKKAIKRQLQCVKRNLKHIDVQLGEVGSEPLSRRQRENLAVIRELYDQQATKYETKNNSIPNRIVSISQPHVRPIVRGKAKASVEFGAKVSISMVEGYAFVDKIGWDAYNESTLFKEIVERHKATHGVYPESVMADRIYRNRENRAYCKAHGIRLSGPRLGRPSKVLAVELEKQERQDSAERNAVEGKFGETKTKYGLDRVMARLQSTSETVISLGFFCANLHRRLRTFLFFIFYTLNIEKLPVRHINLTGSPEITNRSQMVFA